LTDELLFQSAYEKFYSMVKESACFKKYCIHAFGADFSQDGFSDINQINLILEEYIPQSNDLHILDIGCGNGKMLRYLQSQIGGYIHGFDFSENAISTACENNLKNSDFKVGIMGEIDYLPSIFDLIISMDTMYFAKDMNSFVGQIYGWLKSEGVFFIGYQEGDIMPKTDNSETTVVANALKENGFKYKVIDYTKQTYDMLIHKRKAIIKFREEFLQENLEEWYEVILNQTNSAVVSYEEYKKENARYIYIATKG